MTTHIIAMSVPAVFTVGFRFAFTTWWNRFTFRHGVRRQVRENYRRAS
jgi:hypothetical protein